MPNSKKAQTVIRIVGIVGVIALILAAIIASLNQKVPNSEKIWDSETVIGNVDAKNYFVIYSDIVCPYCVAFENAIFEHEADFEKYIRENDVLVEVRLSDFLYEYGEARAISSRYSAEAVYCAKREGKFWDYYRRAITTVWHDYFKDAGKEAFSKLNANTKDYWIELGDGLGLSDNFASCVKNDETLSEIETVATKMADSINGLPYFKFNSYVSSGFDLSWGWDYVLMYFDSGLKSR